MHHHSRNTVPRGVALGQLWIWPQKFFDFSAYKIEVKNKPRGFDLIFKSQLKIWPRPTH